MCSKMPQIITSNLTNRIVDAVFRLLNEISDTQVKDEHMNQFLTNLSCFDGESTNFEERVKGTCIINRYYSNLSLLQKKIVNRTFEIVIMSSDINIVLEKYLYEMDKLISKYP